MVFSVSDVGHRSFIFLQSSEKEEQIMIGIRSTETSHLLMVRDFSVASFFSTPSYVFEKPLFKRGD